MNSAQRSLRARMGAHALHACHDSREITSAARAKFMSRFEEQVDPHGLLTPGERLRRAEHAKKAYFVGLSLRSAQVRSARRKARMP
jgi:hypothetical protein